MDVAEVLPLPAQPRVLALLLREMSAGKPNVRSLNQLFGADPVLTALLLAAANGAAPQLRGQVRCVAQALVVLPYEKVQQLVQQALATVARRAKLDFDMSEFARFSVACAKLARSLAGLAGLEGSAIHTAALLHGVGQLVLHQAQTQGLRDLTAQVGVWDPRRPKWEARTWGYSANNTTAALLRRWYFPSDMIAAIQSMESPMQTDPFDPMAGVLHLAVWCTRAKHSGWSERLLVRAFPVDVALALGIDVDVVLQQEAIDWSQSVY